MFGTSLGSVQSGLKTGWFGLGPCGGHQVDGGTIWGPVALFAARGTSSPDAALSQAEGENNWGMAWVGHPHDSCMHLNPCC